MSADRENELEALKTQIDLRVFAESLGFELDRHKSSANSPLMRAPDGTKTLLGRGRNGHNPSPPPPELRPS